MLLVVLVVLVALLLMAGGGAAWMFGVFDAYDAVPPTATLVTTAAVTGVLGDDPGPTCQDVRAGAKVVQRTCRWGDAAGGTGMLTVDLDTYRHRGLSSGTRRAKRSFAFLASVAANRTRPDGIGDEAVCERPSYDHAAVQCTVRDGNLLTTLTYTATGHPRRAAAHRARLVRLARTVADRLAAP